jgi:hypothetical protein
LTQHETTLEHINMSRWPFTVVPSEESAAVWVGRPDAHRLVQRVLRSAARVDSSQLVLLWAEYGAGKTHALKHLRRSSLKTGGVNAIYVVTPQGIRSFLDLYRSIVDSLMETTLLAEAGRSPVLPDEHSDVTRAARLMAGGGPPAELVGRWLRGDRVPLGQLHPVGISKRIESTSDAILALDGLLAILKNLGTVCLLLDEVQELEALSKQKHDECIGGLHKVFDKNTEGLTLVLSFTTAIQENVGAVIGQALLDRAGTWLTLPSLDRREAVEFVEGLLGKWSLDETRTPFPFTAGAVAAIVDDLAATHSHLSPRAVVRRFDGILRQAEMDIEDGVIQVIDADYARAAS